MSPTESSQQVSSSQYRTHKDTFKFPVEDLRTNENVVGSKRKNHKKKKNAAKSKPTEDSVKTEEIVDDDGDISDENDEVAATAIVICHEHKSAAFKSS